MAWYTQNTLVFGESGSGKSYRIVREAVIDAARGRRDIFLMTENLPYLNVLEELTRNGYDVRVLSIACRPRKSCSYNPLAYVEDTKDIDLIASVLASRVAGVDSEFFYRAAREYLAACIALLMHEGTDLSLPGLYRFITRSHETLENVFDELSSPEPSSFLEYAHAHYSQFKRFCSPAFAGQMPIQCACILAPSASNETDNEDQMRLTELGCTDRRHAIVLEVCDTCSSLDYLANLLVFQAYHHVSGPTVRKDVLFILDDIDHLSPICHFPYCFATRGYNSITTVATIRSWRTCSEDEILEELFGSQGESLKSFFPVTTSMDCYAEPVFRRNGGGNPGKRVRCIETGEEFPTMTQAARWLLSSQNRSSGSVYGIASSISQCAKGRISSVRGTHWEFADQASEKTLPEGN